MESADRREDKGRDRTPVVDYARVERPGNRLRNRILLGSAIAVAVLTLGYVGCKLYEEHVIRGSDITNIGGF